MSYLITSDSVMEEAVKTTTEAETSMDAKGFKKRNDTFKKILRASLIGPLIAHANAILSRSDIKLASMLPL